MNAARIVVFGATGYTGTLLAHALVERGARPILAGRSQEKLSLLASQLGNLETHIADVSDPQSIREILREGDVLVSTVGPFLRWGDAAISAAIEAGAIYLDSTGEPGFIQKVFEHYGPLAFKRSTTLLTASGFDWVPGNLASTLALKEAGQSATSLEVSYLLNGTSAESGGAKASAFAALMAPSFAYRGGKLISERTAARAMRVKDIKGKSRWVLSAGGTEHFTMPERFLQLRNVKVGLGLYGSSSVVFPYISATLNALMKTPLLGSFLRNAMQRSMAGSSGGPSEAERASGSTNVIARTYSSDNKLLNSVALSGVDGFTFTANFLAWAAIHAATHGIQDKGALGPVQAFGLETLTEGIRQSGLTLVK
ncbi:Uncharacterized conserved protein [Serratia sp. CC22-02]|uniref:saccharopine dehydrogenase family protein n=1 Tax=Serratia sp. CC22-02 TaxID=1378076 RepID=UPI0024031AC7|nr:saccharopine dehydrogenase NADP-binding domain-containing protein [Serratia sp. CC22-02]SMP82409.1 Uncharacterized conserved protein [Serratia sp. CC22-02]